MCETKIETYQMRLHVGPTLHACRKSRNTSCTEGGSIPVLHAGRWSNNDTAKDFAAVRARMPSQRRKRASVFLYVCVCVCLCVFFVCVFCVCFGVFVFCVVCFSEFLCVFFCVCGVLFVSLDRPPLDPPSAGPTKISRSFFLFRRAAGVSQNGPRLPKRAFWVGSAPRHPSVPDISRSHPTILGSRPSGPHFSRLGDFTLRHPPLVPPPSPL